MDRDRPVYAYLQSRGLCDSWEEGTFGVLHEEESQVLPQSIRWWPSHGYCLIAPLFSEGAKLVSVQARRVTEPEDHRPKALLPKGSPSTGLVFANRVGQLLIAGRSRSDNAVIIGEGLTDFLALSMTSGVAILSAPGTATTSTIFGSWTKGMDVVFALDADDAGEKALERAACAATSHGARRVVRVRWPRGLTDAAEVLHQFGPDYLTVELERLVSGMGLNRASA